MKKSVCIVEDDKMLCTIFKMFIQQMEYELTDFYQEAKKAVQKIKNKRPDLVIMDIHVPGEIDGIDASKIIEDKFNIPVVYLSSDTRETTYNKASKANAYGYIIKPVYLSTLQLGIDLGFYKFEQQDPEKRDFESYKNFIDQIKWPSLIIENHTIKHLNKPLSSLFKKESKEIVNKNLSEFINSKKQKDVWDKLNYLKKFPLRVEYFNTDIISGEEETIEQGTTAAIVEIGNTNYIQLTFTNKQ